jgi:hypothetical protein
MKGRYFKRIGGVVLAAIMLSGIAFTAATTAEAQRRHGRRRVLIVSRIATNGPHAFDNSSSQEYCVALIEG